MYEDLEINTDNLFYATVVNQKKESRSILVVKSLLGYYDIKNSEEYVKVFISNEESWSRFYNGNIESNLSLNNFVSFKAIVGKTGILTKKDILDVDKKVIKNKNEKGNIEYYYIKEKERTFAIIKPDGMNNVDKIIDMIYKSGLKIEKYEVRNLDEDILREHYSHLVEKPFYPALQNYMMSAPVVLMVLEGENAVETLRTLMGPTDSTIAPSSTIRGKFGTNIQKNAIHGSDSKENAEIEINRFFKEKQKIK